jgi:GAF domain-containing protein
MKQGEAMLEELKTKRPKRSRSLTATLSIAFVVLSLVALLVVSSLELFFNFRSQQEIVAAKQRLIALDAANTVKSFIQERFSELEAAVKFGDLDTASQPVLEQTLKKVLGFQPAFRQLVLFNREGQLVAQVFGLSQVVGNKATSRLEDELFVQTGQGERYISPVYVDEITFEPLVVVAVPVKDTLGDFQGTLVAEVNLKFMWDLVDRLKIGEAGLAYVVDRQGKLLAFKDISRVLAGENVSGLDQVSDFLVTTTGVEDTARANVSVGINGTIVAGTYVPLETPDWAVVTELPVAEVYQELIRNVAIAGGGVLIVATLAAVVGAYLARRLAAPLLNLTETVGRIAGGETELQAAAEGPIEVAQLAEAFNDMTFQLRQLLVSLEDQVQKRTAELAMSVEVGQRATAIRDLDKLLLTITEFVRDKFNLHYVQVFLVDDINQNLVLRAGTGQTGQELLARRLSLPIDSSSTVGQAAVQGRPIIVTDTTIGNIDISQSIPASWYPVLLKKAQAQKPDSLLPETLSELTIPLIVEGRVIGVLDLQNDKVRTFTKDNLNVYEAIAVQLAIAIDSARQWALTQQAQKKAEEAIRQLTREAWAERLASRKDSAGFVYDLSKIASLLPDAYSLTATPENGYSVPLVVQDQAIGYLSVKTPGDRDLTEDERALLQAVAQQLAQKTENLRLFEATQQRASREQIARRIIDRVRTSRNIETALKTAAEELNKALSTARASIDLQIAPHPQQTDDSAKEDAVLEDVEVIEATAPAEGKPMGRAIKEETKE